MTCNFPLLRQQVLLSIALYLPAHSEIWYWKYVDALVLYIEYLGGISFTNVLGLTLCPTSMSEPLSSRAMFTFGESRSNGLVMVLICTCYMLSSLLFEIFG